MPMDYITLLKFLGCNENEIKEWEKILKSLSRVFLFAMSEVLVITPVIFYVFPGILYENGEDIFLFKIIMILLSITYAYVAIIVGVGVNKFTKMTMVTWLPHPIQYVFISTPIFIVYSILILEIFISLTILLAIIYDHLTIILPIIIFLIFFPIFVRSINTGKKKYKITISRRVKGDTDTIADKISNILNTKKKLIVKSQASRTYVIDIPQYSLKIWISRDANRKDYAHISIRGVKEENLMYVKHLIKKIDYAIAKKSPENY